MIGSFGQLPSEHELLVPAMIGVLMAVLVFLAIVVRLGVVLGVTLPRALYARIRCQRQMRSRTAMPE